MTRLKVRTVRPLVRTTGTEVRTIIRKLCVISPDVPRVGTLVRTAIPDVRIVGTEGRTIGPDIKMTGTALPQCYQGVLRIKAV